MHPRLSRRSSIARAAAILVLMSGSVSAIDAAHAQVTPPPVPPLSLPTLPLPGGLDALGALLTRDPRAASGLRVGCAFFPRSRDRNTGFEDANAVYQIANVPLALPDGASLRIEGTFQPVRYFSLQSYDGPQGGNLIDSLPDARTMPTSGLPLNPNPALLPAAAYGQPYTVTLRYRDPPANLADREPNVLYMGAPKTGYSPTRASKQIIYRTYLANPGIDATTLPVPRLIYSGATGEIPLEQTPDQARCNLINTLENSFASPNPAVFPTRDIKFVPIANTGSTVFYPNGDIYYLRASAATYYGDMVVLRTKKMPAPPLPPLVDPNTQVRYWSFCHYNLATGAYADCRSDRELVTQPDGYQVIVLSTAAKRPPFATEANGYNWLAWGSSNTELFALRQMLSAPGFPGNYAQAFNDPTLPVSMTLGVWAPQISYCDAATFAMSAPSGGDVLLANCMANARGPLLPTR